MMGFMACWERKTTDDWIWYILCFGICGQASAYIKDIDLTKGSTLYICFLLELKYRISNWNKDFEACLWPMKGGSES